MEGVTSGFAMIMLYLACCLCSLCYIRVVYSLSHSQDAHCPDNNTVVASEED